MTWDVNAGTRVDDSLPPLWPGNDPFPGTGIAGCVRSYSKAKGKKEDYVVCELAGAVIHTPGHKGNPTTLVRHERYALAVPTWLARFLTPELTPPGTYVAITYVGMQGDARKMELRLVDKPYLTRLWKGAATDTARAEGRKPAAAPADGDDDLPF